jgi:AraC-like DNA-binding protein
MEGTLFRDKFHFTRYRFDRPHYTDKRTGITCHYFGYMRAGRAKLVSSDRTVEVREGDLFYIPNGLCYQSYWEGDPQVCFDSYGFDFLPEGDEGTYALQKIAINEEAAALLARLGEYEITTDTRTLGYFFLLFAAVCPIMERQSARRAHAVVATALAYMEQLYELNIPELARHCRVSESGLFAAFRAEKESTPLACFHRLQAERAVRLLTSTDLSVEEIAFRLGFCSAAYFRRILHRTVGKTPREIRRENLV